jgi:hypothetical protein
MTWAAAEARAAEGEEPADSRPRRKPGVKAGGDANWILAEKMFVHGGSLGGDGKMVYPSLSEIAERIGVSKAAVGHRDQRYGWKVKREEAEAGVRSAEVRKALESGKRPTLGHGAVLDAYLALFEEAILAGRVPIGNFGDFERAVNFKRKLEAEDRATTERAGVLTLDQLRDRHRGRMDQESGLPDEAAGILSHGRDEAEAEAASAANLASAPVSDPWQKGAKGGKRDPNRVAATVRKRQSTPVKPPKAAGKPRPKPPR